MKSWEVAAEVRADPVLNERVSGTQPLIEDVLGPTSSGLVRAPLAHFEYL